MAGTKPPVSTQLKQSIIGLSLWLAAETDIGTSGWEKSELPREAS